MTCVAHALAAWAARGAAPARRARALSTASEGAPLLVSRLRALPLQLLNGTPPPPLASVQGALAAVDAALRAAPSWAAGPTVHSAVCDAALAALQASARVCAPPAHTAHVRALLPALVPYLLAVNRAPRARELPAWAAACDAPDDLAAFCAPPRLVSHVAAALVSELPRGGAPLEWLPPLWVPSLLECLAASGAHDLRAYSALLAYGRATAAWPPPPPPPPPVPLHAAATATAAGPAVAAQQLRHVARMLRAALSIAPAGGDDCAGGGGGGPRERHAASLNGSATGGGPQRTMMLPPRTAAGAAAPMKKARVLQRCAGGFGAAMRSLAALATAAAPSLMAAVQAALRQQDASALQLRRELRRAVDDADPARVARLLDAHAGIGAPASSSSSSSSDEQPPAAATQLEAARDLHGPAARLPGVFDADAAGPLAPGASSGGISAVAARDVLLISAALREAGRRAAAAGGGDGADGNDEGSARPRGDGGSAAASAAAPPASPRRRLRPLQVPPGLRYLAMHVHYQDAERRRREAAPLVTGDLGPPAPVAGAAGEQPSPPALVATQSLLQLAVMRGLVRVCSRLCLPQPALHFPVSTGALFDAAWPEACVAICFGPCALPPLDAQAAEVERRLVAARPALAALLQQQQGSHAQRGASRALPVPTATGAVDAAARASGRRHHELRDDDVRAQTEDARILQQQQQQRLGGGPGVISDCQPLQPLPPPPQQQQQHAGDPSGGRAPAHPTTSMALAAHSLWVGTGGVGGQQQQQGEEAEALVALARAVAAADAAGLPFVHTTAQPRALWLTMLAHVPALPSRAPRASRLGPAQQGPAAAAPAAPIPRAVAGYHALLTSAAHQAGFNVFYVWKHELLALRGPLRAAAGLPAGVPPPPLLPHAALATAEADARFVLAVESLVLRKLAKLQAVLGS